MYKANKGCCCCRCCCLPKLNKYDTRESLVQAPCYAEKLQKSYVWLKSQHTKAQMITVDVASCL